jgi:hypothetical protein
MMKIRCRNHRYALFAGLLLVTLARPGTAETVSLAEIRRQDLAYVETAQAPGKPFGFYRDRPGSTHPPSLYAACDVAHIRTVMREDSPPGSLRGRRPLERHLQ